MPVHLQREIEGLKKKLLTVCGMVEESLWRSVKAYGDRDAALAREVVGRDAEIDAMEVAVEEDCLKALALHQPVAGDLRFIVAVLKINNDLERIGDLAVNVAKRSLSLAELEPIGVGFDLVAMGGRAQEMLRMSLDSLVNLDAELARRVCAIDDEVDAMHRRTYALAKETLADHPEWRDVLLQHISVSYHLERVADHATNVAEDVIYLVEGKIVRHPDAARG